MVKKKYLVLVAMLVSHVCGADALTLRDSNLPIVKINTNGQSIPDEPKITAQMTIYWQPGTRNNVADDSTNYQGHIGIEKRGNSSQSWPKKPYKLETRHADGTNFNISLIGLPVENDWVFHAPYVDKTLMRNALVYRLMSEMGWYAPHYRYCELIINGSYKGVYVLVESLKIDKNRLALVDTFGVTGSSYLLEMTTLNRLSKGEPYLESAIAEQVMGIKYPTDTALTNERKAYITNYINDFEKALYNKTYSGAGDYKNYIDVPSFIDHMMMSEVVRQLDFFCASQHFHMNAGGKLTMGPAWDFNRAMGNYKGHDEWKTTGIWMTATRGGCKPFWSWHIYEDDAFMDAFKARYAALRDNVLSTAHMYAILDEYAAYLDEAKERNFQIWDINENRSHKYVQGSYGGEVDYVKTWLAERLNWLDDRWAVDAKAQINEIYPDGEGSGMSWIELFNPYGRRVDVSNWQVKVGETLCKIPSNTHIEAHDYLVLTDQYTLFKSQYPTVTTVKSLTQMGRFEDGVEVLLMDDKAQLVERLSIQATEGWPNVSRAGNYALALRPIAYEKTKGVQWNWSKKAGGTPGRKNEVYNYEGLIISEIMAANSSSIKDEYKQHDDWVELSNTGLYNINLCGLYLTDRMDQMDKWMIKDSLHRNNTFLDPGQSIVLWLDKDAYRQGNLHANFEADAQGERLLLSYSDGYNHQLIDHIYPPALQPDYSYQLSDWANQTWVVSDVPTPGRLDNNTAHIADNEAIVPQWCLWPNPAQDHINVEFDVESKQSIRVDLRDSRGALVDVLLTDKLYASGHYAYRFALRKGLPQGIYILQLRGDNGVSSLKFIKSE